MTPADWDVVVIGAGPVGLALALGLARAGRSTIVLEKNLSTSEYSRAPIIWPRTLEVLAELGVVEAFRNAGMVRTEIELRDADRDRALLRLSLHELRHETECPEVLILPQADTERLLLEALEREPTAEVCFGAEATAVESGDNGATVHFERSGAARSVTGSFVAGCDGAHSTVREELHVSFEGRTYSMRAALADIETDEAEDVTSPRMTRERGVATGIRIEPGVWRVILPRARNDELPLDEALHTAVRDLLSVETYRTLWKSEFRLHRRIATSFRSGRIVLAGDAAHLTSPVGGQGMNLGLQDAAELTRALGESLDSGSDEAIDAYERQRRQALKGGAVQVTDTMTEILLARRGAFLVPALRLMSALLRIPPIRRTVLRRMALLDDPSRSG